MWKQIYELVTQLFTITQRLDRQDEVIERLREELKANSELHHRLILEYVRTNDELKRNAEREAEARKLFQVQIENQLLRAERQLPPASAFAEPAVSFSQFAALQSQVTALAAALQTSNEQAARHQQELEQLKTQVATLLAA
jgi:hypothetical protein